jgi:dTDP-4-dehydrorhamnose reductase
MTARRILLLGSSGQLGWALQRALAIRGEVFAFDRAACDLADLRQLRSVVRETRPDVVVNAAAYTAVDKAESEPDLAHRINAVAPEILAEETKSVGALLVHYSTDYVFDGEKAEHYVETDEPRPLGAYGKSKFAGEEAIHDKNGAHLIFRTSWVYGLYGKNFPKTILGIAKERDGLRVVADQIGAPTSVDLIADATAHCLGKWFAEPSIRESGSGLYHLTASGETSWHGLACELVRQARAGGLPVKLSPEMIEPIATHDYPTAARRPANSRLATRKIVDVFHLRLPPWQLHVQRLTSEIGNIRA